MRAAWLLLLAGLPALAQDPPPEVFTQQRGGTFVPPPARVEPVYVPAGPDTPVAPQRGPERLNLQLALDLPLRGSGRSGAGRGTQGSTAASPTLQAHLRWRPVPDSWWFAQLGFHRYLQGDRQQPWHPDFSYSFGYEDWHPGTWSIVYANYTGTRFHPDRAAGEGRSHFPQGQWTLGYRFALPAALEPWLLAGDGDQATCSANGHYMPRYVDSRNGAMRPGKVSASLACRYQRASGWYADLAVHAWPDRSQQQPWDPDFTYGFGWADWRPGRISIRYNNDSGNRFPGRVRGAGEGSFRSGSVSLWWSTPL